MTIPSIIFSNGCGGYVEPEAAFNCGYEFDGYRLFAQGLRMKPIEAVEIDPATLPKDAEGKPIVDGLMVSETGRYYRAADAMIPAPVVAATEQSEPALGCDFALEYTTWECRGDGFLWDADRDGFDPNEQDYPCPQCNTLAYLLNAKEEAETCSEWSMNNLRGTGETIWLNAVRIAEKANLDAARAALTTIGIVKALVADPQAEDGCRVQNYVY